MGTKTEGKKVHLRDGDILVGVPLLWNAFDNNGVLLLRKGQIVESEKQLGTLLERGLQVNQHEIEYIVTTPAIDLINDVQERFEAVLEKISGLIQRNKKESVPFEGDKGFPVEILDLCRMLQDACEKDLDACIGKMFSGSDRKYVVKHPIHIAVVCEAVTKQMKWSKNDRLTLIAAAITSNIGMIDLQEKLHHQKEPLTDEQRIQIQEHPERAVEILIRSGVSNRLWLDAVLHHHEAIDGSGYPRKFKGYSIPIRSRMIAVGDIYCAGISNRSYRSSMSPDEVMRMVYVNGDKRLDKKMVDICVKIVGLYPPGTFVSLANGEIAVVTHRGEQLHQPIVHSIAGADGTQFTDPLKRDCSNEIFAIKGILLKDALNIEVDPCKLWGVTEEVNSV